ncbi:MAG: TonB-dependent outer membrane protein SusC/RagA [Gemmatimonadetes bacterium]|nr:TonB-dependent outer membrane protein SusC/RagA [Gemmatimonadota bacterium]
MAGAIGAMSARPAQAARTMQQVTSTMTGVVTDARSQQPLAGVTVVIVGTRFGTQTGTDGRFRIGGVGSGTVEVSARRIGYATRRQTATVAGEQTVVSFALEPAAAALDEIVVTGTAGGELRRSVGNAVATIDAADAMSKSGAQSVSSLIGARAPGVIIAPSTSRLGAGPTIQIRGRSSIGLDNSPLLFVDGVRVSNATNAGPVAPAGRLGGQASNVSGRLNDINPDDIESIEIIKGPAAATIYGTEAANGVIQIITKKGAAGNKPQLSFMLEEGSIYFRDAAGRVPTNYDKDATGTIISFNGVQAEANRGTPIYKTGQTRKYNGSLSGGRDAVTYFLSSSYENDLGVEPNNTLRQGTFRANLNVQPAANLDFSSSLGFATLSSHLGADVGASVLLGAELGHPLLFPGGRGFYPNYTPDVPQSLYDNAQGVTRLTGSATLTHRTTSWLTQRAVVGVDQTGDDSRAIEHFTSDPAIVALIGAAAAGGSIGQTLRHNTIYSAEYTATAKSNLTSSLTQTSSIGGQFYRTELNSSFLGGTGFPGLGVETVNAASTPASSTQSQTLNTTIGAYGQEQFGWRDRLFLTGALRVDNNSAFGDKLKWVTYPKASLSWVASEEPFWRKNDLLTSLRLRAAYGQSGRQPAAFSALRTFSPTQGPGSTNAVTPNSIGNANLKPERGSEVEVGFESQFFNRLDIDLTYFNKKTTDEIINQPVAPSSGFYVSTPTNLGRVDNSGFELLATLQAMSRRNFSWDIVGNIATSKDVIRDLGGVGGVVISAGQTNVIGGPIGGFYSRRVVSADRDATTGLATNVLCDGGDGKPSIACASAPFVFIGTPTPKVTGSVANTFSFFNRFRLYGLVDFKRGNRVANSVEQLRCTGGAGAPLCRANYYPLEYEPVYLAERVGTAAAQGILDQYYQDASFAKLREVSVSYSLPASLLHGYQSASITLAGRDLHTWTKYAGVDPEVNVNNVATSSAASDQAVTPPLSRFIVTFNLKL